MRFIIDEVHILLTSDFRESALIAATIRTGRSVPLITLSATVPPLLEAELKSIIAAPDLHVLRSSSVRDNVGISVETEANLSERVQRATSAFRSQDRAIVFVMSRQNAVDSAADITAQLQMVHVLCLFFSKKENQQSLSLG